jgi:hypothetical protein
VTSLLGSRVLSGSKAALFALVLLSLVASASCGQRKLGAERLTIKVRGGDFGERRYTLRCDPAHGTVPTPAAACATLRAHPDALDEHSGRGHSCPPGTPTYEIAGTSGGAAVAASFSACFSGQEDGLAVWTRLVSYDVPALRGRPTVEVDAGVGPVRLGQRVETIEHGARGQLLDAGWVLYRFADRGVLLTHYDRERRVDKIEPSFSVEFGNANVLTWPHFVCRRTPVYWHATGAKWTVVRVEPSEPRRWWHVIVGTGTAPTTCAALEQAQVHEG